MNKQMDLLVESSNVRGAFTPATRTTDPETSSAAENHMNATGKRKSHCDVVLAAVKQWPGRTAPELTTLIDRKDIDRYEVTRRLGDLQVGMLSPVVPGEKRGRFLTWFERGHEA